MTVNNKVCLLIFFSALISFCFFLPLDFVWFILLSLIIGFVESILFLVQRSKRRKGIFLLLCRGSKTNNCTLVGCSCEISDDIDCNNTFSDSIDLIRFCSPISETQLLHRRESERLISDVK